LNAEKENVQVHYT